MMYEDFLTEYADGAYVLTPSYDEGYTVSVSDSPDTKGDLVGHFCKQARITTPHLRPFFHIVSDSGRYSVAAKRVFDVDGLVNMRDLGGYNTGDGFVRYGFAYRGERLYNLTEKGREQFAALHIPYIADYRADDEVERRPDPPVEGAVYHHLPSVQIEGTGFSSELVMTYRDEQYAELHKWFMSLYEVLPFGSTGYRDLFRQLVSGNTPVYFHCTAGKDRTGIAAALILSSLGVPYEAIEEDYIMSNTLRAGQVSALYEKYGKYLSEVALNAVQSMFCVAASSLKMSFERIYDKYPTFSDYMVKELLVTPEDQELLKQKYIVRH